MAKYRKKPVVIDAVQWFKDGDHPAVIEHVHTIWDKEVPVQINRFYSIGSLEGPMRVSPGDWIITGVKGEHYPCKPDIFDVTYDLVTD